MNYLYGPLISSSDGDFHQRMFEQVFELETVSQAAMDSDSVSRVFGLTHCSATFTALVTPATRYGVCVVEFDPGANETIRHRSRGLVPGAAKVIDFFVRDLEQALARARDFGLQINDEIATYQSPEGTVREAHAWVLDEVVCAMIDPPPAMMEKFSCDLQRAVSEPQSISGPTTELEASADFFHRLFGFEVIYRYEVNDSNFGEMIGSTEPVNIKAKNVGWNLRAPYIGMIDYGLAKPGDETIKPVLPPIRGLLGVIVITDEMAAVVSRAPDDAVLVPLSRGGLPGPWETAQSLLLRAPNGMALLVIEP